MANATYTPSRLEGEGRGEVTSSTEDALSKIPPLPNPLPQGEREFEQAIIVHTLEDMLAALESASELHTPVILQSPPDAIFYAGSQYLLNMFRQAQAAFPQAQARFILDCSDAGAEAVAAMQAGHTHIRSSAPPALRDKLARIAQQLGVTLVGEGGLQSVAGHNIKTL